MKRYEIERRSTPRPDVFYQEYMAAMRPVVLTDLFRGQPIRTIESKETAILEWGDIRIPVDAYYDAAIGIEQVRSLLRDRQAIHGTPTHVVHTEDSAEMSLESYLELVTLSAGTQKARVAFPPVPEMERYFSVPEFCEPLPDESAEVTKTCFIGNKGSFSQLHFDKCGAHGVLYCVYGEKRFIVIPPEASNKLAPFTQFSGWFITNFSDADRADFLRYTGGAEVILRPGEAIYMPPFCWHFADYLDDCCGINIRFRRSARVTTVVNAFFPDMYMQAIGNVIAHPDTSDDVYRGLADAITTVQNNPSLDGVEQTRRLRALAHELYTRVCPDAPPGSYAAHDPEAFFPSPLPTMRDAFDPRRPKYS